MPSTDREIVADLANRHDLPEEAVQAMLDALRRSGGSMAQFNHAGLGGMGQWSGGMTMIGDMFNDSLKAKVSAVATDLAQHVRSMPAALKSAEARGDDQVSYRSAGTSSDWWPDGLGHAASAGSQNGLRYAVFPSTHRLAIEDGGKVSTYDTGDHRISGVGQAQGGGATITFTSQHGTVRVADLRKL